MLAYAVALVCVGLGTVLMSDVARSLYSGIVVAADRASLFQDLASMEKHLGTLQLQYHTFVAEESLAGRPLAAAQENSETRQWEITLKGRPDGIWQWFFERRAVQEACDHANMLRDRIEWTKRKVERLRGDLVSSQDYGSLVQPVLRYGAEIFMHLPFALYLYVVAIRFFCRGLLVAGALRPISLNQA